MVEPIVCGESNLINLEEIIDKINELIDDGNEFELCCDELKLGERLRAKAAGTRLFITSDGSAPDTTISLPDPLPDPIDSFMNTVVLNQWIFNTVDMVEVYFDGELVFYKTLYLELPQYVTQINLADFINANNPDNFPNVVVYNRLIQPEFISGDLSHLAFVELITEGEFQGFSSSGDAMTFTSPMKLTSTGWAKGAGGDGGDGSSGGVVGTIPSIVGVWEGRASYDDGGPYVSGQISPLWCNIPQCGRHAYYNRFWKSSGPTSGAWVMSSGASGQEYWDVNNRSTNHAPIWGDQGPCHYNTSGSWCKAGMYVAVQKSTSISGGRVGVGGSGQGFRVDKNAGQTTGIDGYYSGPASGFTLSSGKNMNEGINIPLPTPGPIENGDGGVGGGWAEAGGPSSDGNPGKPAGKAIVGVSFLTHDSVLGNTIGVIE